MAEPTLCSHKANPRQSKRGTGEACCPVLATRPRPEKRKRNGTKSRSGPWLPCLWLGSPWCFPNYRCRFPGLPLLQTATCHRHSPPAAALLPKSLQGGHRSGAGAAFQISSSKSNCCGGQLTAAYLSHLGASAENIWLFLQECSVCLNLKQTTVTRIWAKCV